MGEGRAELDSGRDAVGGFGGGKKFVEEISSEAGRDEAAAGELPVSRTGN
jgi:hypothetical protein